MTSTSCLPMHPSLIRDRRSHGNIRNSHGVRMTVYQFRLLQATHRRNHIPQNVVGQRRGSVRTLYTVRNANVRRPTEVQIFAHIVALNSLCPQREPDEVQVFDYDQGAKYLDCVEATWTLKVWFTIQLPKKLAPVQMQWTDGMLWPTILRPGMMRSDRELRWPIQCERVTRWTIHWHILLLS